MPVVMGNRGSKLGTVPFLEVLVTRTAIASRDLVIPILEVNIDDLEINFDDEIKEGLEEFAQLDLSGNGAAVGTLADDGSSGQLDFFIDGYSIEDQSYLSSYLLSQQASSRSSAPRSSSAGITGLSETTAADAAADGVRESRQSRTFVTARESDAGKNLVAPTQFQVTEEKLLHYLDRCKAFEGVALNSLPPLQLNDVVHLVTTSSSNDVLSRLRDVARRGSYTTSGTTGFACRAAAASGLSNVAPPSNLMSFTSLAGDLDDNDPVYMETLMCHGDPLNNKLEDAISIAGATPGGPDVLNQGTETKDDGTPSPGQTTAPKTPFVKMRAHYVKASRRLREAQEKRGLLSPSDASANATDAAGAATWKEAMSGLLTWKEVQHLANVPVTLDPLYRIPDVPPILQIDQLRISKVGLLVWVELLLDNIDGLPESAKTVLRVLSFGNSFTVERGELEFPSLGGPPQHLSTSNTYEEHGGSGVRSRAHSKDAASRQVEQGAGAAYENDETIVRITPFRGSMVNFVQILLDVYTRNLVQNVMHVIGKSGTLTLARSPLQALAKTGTLFVDSFGGLLSDGAHIFSHFTFDEDYIREQRRIRRMKKQEIDGILAGGGEALKSLGDGAVGLLDVFVKPIEGAQEDGVAGFFTGLGKGLMGTLVKPVSKIGEAISDVGQGISAGISSDKNRGGRSALHRSLVER
ncbi:unnamed protein product, partial [Amoebophrya sp. A25]|eukprot:GSA25T00004547001.1